MIPKDFSHGEIKFIRENSLNKKKIEEKSHKLWIKNTQNSKKGIWLIYAEGNIDIGHCSAIYISKKNVSWSFYIGEKNFSPGCGIRMLVFFLKKLFFKEGISKIEAKIIPDNQKSKKIHQELGFTLQSKNDNFEIYTMTKDIFKKRYYVNI